MGTDIQNDTLRAESTDLTDNVAGSSDIANRERNRLLPFLKWAGGKRWLVRDYPEIFPHTFGRYFEPFLGSAAVFFFLNPKRGLLSDTCGELIETYQAIKTDWHSVLINLKKHHRNHDAHHYYSVRDQHPLSLPIKAARTVYLNRTCFNGLYRVSLAGRFNVPIGSKTEVLFPTDDFEEISKRLKNMIIVKRDFESSVKLALKNDFVFADPPYTVAHNNNGFVKYNERLFAWTDQERLAETLTKASRRGVKVLCTNADHPSIRKLYKKSGFQLTPVKRYSAISGTAIHRKQFGELLIHNLG